VDSSKVLFTVVDVRQMWLTLDLRVEDAKLIALGQQVRFRPDGSKVAKGRIVWISTEADHKTRTVKVRASLDNTEGHLRANTFGTGQVVLREESYAVVVPNAAVHWEGCCHVIFVRDKDFFKEGSPKVFHVRTVRQGAKDEKYTEIIAGVLPGEVVATQGSGVLRSELLRNNLGAG
jgi:membrane fusion protein, heavy metal efflux system